MKSSLLIALVVLSCLVVETSVNETPTVRALSRSGALALNTGEDKPFAAVIDAANGFAYFGTPTSPGVIIKVRLSDFTRVGTLTLSENSPFTAVIDAPNGFAYFGTQTSPGKIVKIRLSDFTEVAVLTLKTNEDEVWSSVIDAAAGYAYFGTAPSVNPDEPPIIVKVRLSDFKRVDTFSLPPASSYPGAHVRSAVVYGGFGYFGLETSPGAVLRLRLSDFTYAGYVVLNYGENILLSATLDSVNGFAYFGTWTNPGIVVKIRLSDFTRVGALQLNVGEQELRTAVTDTAVGFAYFGAFSSPGNIVKVRLSNFTRAEALTLNSGENQLASSVIDTGNEFAYFGTWTTPGIIVKVDLLRGTNSSTLQTSAGTGAATLTTSQGVFSSMSVTAESSLPISGMPLDLTFPQGFFNFTIAGLTPGATITVTITLPGPLPAGVFSYWKVHDGIWLQMPTSKVSLDSTRNRVTLILTDGASPDDDDGLANGVIFDIGAPAVNSLQKTVPISLVSGWNLISLPLVSNNTATNSLFSRQIALKQLSAVWGYVGLPRSWKFFIPGKSSTLTTMTDGNGYWAFVTAPSTVYINGTVIPPAGSPPSYALTTGWNLVGFKPQPTITSNTVGQYLMSISGSYDQNNVWVYGNTSGNWVRADSNYILQPGEAMWVLMTASATLRP